jgi:hypothetical protein
MFLAVRIFLHARVGFILIVSADLIYLATET